MKRIFLVCILLLLLISPISAEIDEKMLEKKVKESVFKKILDYLGITSKVSEEINKTNPEVMKNLTKTCEKTSGARTLIFILTILTVIGWIQFYPAGLVLTIVDILVILNYFCWFSF